MSTAVAEKPATKPKPPPKDTRKPPTVTFEIERNDWCAILSDAAIFGSRDPSLPMLTCVRVRIGTDGKITADATDRFTMGRRTFHLNEEFPASVEVLVPIDEVTAIAKIHGAARRGNKNPLSVTVVGGLPLVVGKPWAAQGGTITISSGGGRQRKVVSTHPGIASGYVDIDALIDAAMGVEPEPLQIAAFRPEYIARFSKVSRRNGESMRVTLTKPHKPMIVTIGDHFVGMVMPMNIRSSEAKS